MYVSIDAGFRDYTRYVPILRAGYEVLMQSLAQSPLVQSKWRELSQIGFWGWASSIGGLGLGVASAKVLDQKLQEMLG